LELESIDRFFVVNVVADRVLNLNAHIAAARGELLLEELLPLARVRRDFDSVPLSFSSENYRSEGVPEEECPVTRQVALRHVNLHCIWHNNTD